MATPNYTRDHIGLDDLPAAPFIVSNFKPFLKNTLLGFFDVELPSGLILRGLTLHQKGDSQWCGMPAKPYKKVTGEESWVPVVEFSTREKADNFRDACLLALDAGGYLAQ